MFITSSTGNNTPSSTAASTTAVSLSASQASAAGVEEGRKRGNFPAPAPSGARAHAAARHPAASHPACSARTRKVHAGSFIAEPGDVHLTHPRARCVEEFQNLLNVTGNFTSVPYVVLSIEVGKIWVVVCGCVFACVRAFVGVCRSQLTRQLFDIAFAAWA